MYKKWLIAMEACAVFATPLSALAQTGGVYDLSWNTIDPGGATGITGGVYSLAGTVGQIEAGIHSGGVYILNGGFWSGAIDAATDVEPFIDVPAIPARLALYPAVPNPFRHETSIAFSVPSAMHATAHIYNLGGALVRTLLDEGVTAGRHEVAWAGTNDEGSRVAPGVYLVRLEAGSEVVTSKLVQSR